MGVGHAEALRLAIHRFDKRAMPSRIVPREAGRRAVFRRHQREAQHFAARELASQAKARVATLEQIDVGDVDRERLIHGLGRVEHDHRRHQFGDRSDGCNRVGGLGIDRVSGARIEHQYP